jgi:hypothetical protein
LACESENARAHVPHTVTAFDGPHGTQGMRKWRPVLFPGERIGGLASIAATLAADVHCGSMLLKKSPPMRVRNNRIDEVCHSDQGSALD